MEQLLGLALLALIFGAPAWLFWRNRKKRGAVYGIEMQFGTLRHRLESGSISKDEAERQAYEMTTVLDDIRTWHRDTYEGRRADELFYMVHNLLQQHRVR